MLFLDPEKQTSLHGNDDTPGLGNPTAQHHNNGHSTVTAGMYYNNGIITPIYLVPFSKGVPSAPAELTLQDVASQAGLQQLDTLDQECSQQVLLNLAKHCVEWQLIGFHLELPKADIVAVDGDYRSIEEKRIGMLGRWKEKFAFKATYRVLIEALFSCGKASDAIEACKVITSRK